MRHLFAAYDLREDKLYGHIKPRKTQSRFLEFCRYLRTFYPPTMRIVIICDIFSPPDHPQGPQNREWAPVNNAEFAYGPANRSRPNGMEAQFTALLYFTLYGTDHASHLEQASLIRRYIIWRNNHAYGERLCRIVGGQTWLETALAVTLHVANRPLTVVQGRGYRV